ncbi:MAG: hypothetical protein WKF35_02500 [Ferruginibacter sp.]
MSSEEEINSFIKDFNLRQSDGVIGFAARIIFHLNGYTKERYTEVQVLKGNDLNAIYLINPDLPFEDLPDTFLLSASSFEYIPNDRLEIYSKENMDNYVEIFPVVV